MRNICLVVLVVLPATASAGEGALDIFKQRILPIFQAKHPSSCTECHLSSVDLKDYIHPDQAKTFASLVESGLIDVDDPGGSKILEFIARKPEKPNLISDKIRRQEYEAFRAWITAAAKDPGLLKAKASQVPIGPSVPVEVIRHARRDRVLASFIENVWVERGRCANCHSPDRNQKQVKNFGEQVSWIKPGDPAGTMKYMVEAGLIDLDEPRKSLLVAKPTTQVEHAGGYKLTLGDRTYRQFLRFASDYAAIVNDEYASPDQLPKPTDEIFVKSEIKLRIEKMPERFLGKIMRVDVYPWIDGGWTKRRWATADNHSWKNKHGQFVWQAGAYITAPRGSQRAAEVREDPSLPPGKALLRFYMDEGDKLKKDWYAELGEDDFIGQLEVKSQWPRLPKSVTMVGFPTQASKLSRRD